MVAWDRDMPWRQGKVLTSESSVALGVIGAEDAGIAMAIVISHDCDLTQSPETGAGWQWIELLGCEPISDEAMTYAMSTQLKKWNMDYLSLRADPPIEPMRE